LSRWRSTPPAGAASARPRRSGVSSTSASRSAVNRASTNGEAAPAGLQRAGAQFVQHNRRVLAPTTEAKRSFCRSQQRQSAAIARLAAWRPARSVSRGSARVQTPEHPICGSPSAVPSRPPRRSARWQRSRPYSLDHHQRRPRAGAQQLGASAGRRARGLVEQVVGALRYLGRVSGSIARPPKLMIASASVIGKMMRSRNGRRGAASSARSASGLDQFTGRAPLATR